MLQAAVNFSTWEFWEKPLQGAVQWVIVGVLGLIVVRLGKMTPKAATTVKGHFATAQSRFYVWSSCFDVGTAFVVIDSARVLTHYGPALTRLDGAIKGLAWAATFFAYYFRWFTLKAMIHDQKQRNTIALIVSAVAGDTTKMDALLNDSGLRFFYWELFALHAAAAVAFYIAIFGNR